MTLSSQSVLLLFLREPGAWHSIPSSHHPLRLQWGREGCSQFTDEQTEIQQGRRLALGPSAARSRAWRLTWCCLCPAFPASVTQEALSSTERNSTCSVPGPSLGPGDTVLTTVTVTVHVNRHTNKELQGGMSLPQQTWELRGAALGSQTWSGNHGGLPVQLRLKDE